MIDILFISKYRESKSKWEDPRTINPKNKLLSSGLFNSLNFLKNALIDVGITCAYEHVIDSNYIYKEINKYKPKVVIIEALWAMPAKFVELSKIYPNIKWVLRLHSDLPFIANEGIFTQWFFQYLNIKNMFISCNSQRMFSSLKHFVTKDKLLYLPNYYPLDEYNEKPKIRNLDDRNILNIGCFGAIRNLKNQLFQAFAAIEIADKLGKTLNFHINATRIEGKSESVIKNIKNLFEHNKRHNLISHYWMDHSTFLDIISNLDISLQISLTETFNIIAADSVNRNVPTIVSNEIYWADNKFKVEPTNYDDLLNKMFFIFDNKDNDMIYLDNKRALKQYCDNVIPTWKLELNKIYSTL